MGLTMRQRKAVTSRMHDRYRAANKRRKGLILDEFIHLTGYARKYAIDLLRQEGPRRKALAAGGGPRGRPRRYDGAVMKALTWLWYLFGYMCGKRLVVAIRTNLEALQRYGEMTVDPWVQERLLTISASTIDRLLKQERKRTELRGRSYTKPGSLRNHQIPIRTFSDWNEAQVGFVEADLVGHDGGNNRGDFAQTLTVTDVKTGWTEVRAVKNKAQRWVFAALKKIRGILPFEVKGIDSDNGSEFINSHLFRYCSAEQITFTRSRPYRKNDSCFVEQKNYAVVRTVAGYFRYETQAQVRLLNAIYREYRLLVNFFYPSMKLVEKRREGSKVRKRYDTPKTPYQRVLQAPEVAEARKEALREQYATLNLAEITRRMAERQEMLRKMTVQVMARSQDQRRRVLRAAV
jgi:hypothetical protein